ncbi:MAG: hypothetical protein KGZ86_00855 [Candidatus Latescibacteria bacterium]|nr:hypothetical protein [Candidatus Latescibacterota bacterium]
MITAFLYNTIILYFGLNLVYVFPLSVIISSTYTRESLLKAQGLLALFCAMVAAWAM